MIFKYINFPVFIASLAIGLFYVYILSKPQQVIYVYPTENNQNSIQYLDKTNNCFNFKMEELQCPNHNNVKKIIAQI
tara:strand:- start:1039 stop:1269 length:231 start_codon:yes stop_codon:yes gene_type:complete